MMQDELFGSDGEDMNTEWCVGIQVVELVSRRVLRLRWSSKRQISNVG